MATTRQDQLQALASSFYDDATAISVYVDLEPSVTPTPDALSARVRSLVDEVGRRRPSGGAHDTKVGFDAAHARLGEFLSSQRLPDRGRVHALAVFARGDDVFETATLTHAVPDRVSVGPIFSLLPLAVEASRSRELLVLLASREQGLLWRVRDGALEEVFSDAEEAENRHAQGGWAQSKLQRWTDRTAQLHLADVVEHLERVHGATGRPPILISATDENAAVVRDRLGQEAQAALIGRVAHERDWSEPELLDQAARELHDLDQRREDELLERHAAQVGRGESDDLSADAALAALSDSRAEWLLLSRAPAFEAWRCPNDGRLAAAKGRCPLDSAQLRQLPDAADAAVIQALLHGTSVWQLLDDRPELDGSDGVAVVTRF